MEYAENGSLLDILRRDKFIDEVRSRHWYRQLLDVVDYCHDKGVVHRYFNILHNYQMHYETRNDPRDIYWTFV